ncbi:MAG: carbohydrate kinase family protein [Actinobacteria bacterium]|jgi:ribokinase|nr:carbohydrate kinase family protein [Actinomycetota bacterium]NCU89587.1 carbohydrate kinase family protein [Actinomycetota bacterium]NDE53225.1 carbohydrate kinase family protein [Actinomycetota bacterium]
MSRFLCIGDAALDVIVKMQTELHVGSDTSSQISMHGGGAAANTATWLANLGHSVYFSCRLGNDAAGRAIAAEFDQWGIEYRKEFLTNEKTGVVVVLVNNAGERTMFPDSGANSGIDEKNLPPLVGFDAAFLSGYSLFNPLSTSGVLRMISMIKAANIPLIFDPASVGTMTSFGRERVLEMLSVMDIAIMNDDEARFIAGKSELNDALESLTSLVPLVVIKTGSSGAIAQLRGDTLLESKTEAIAAIDTTGAGDAFAAGFIPRWLESHDPLESMKAGNEVARRCVAIIGARPSVNPK